MRRGILGGTFDPPHMAHLVAADAASRQLDLDVVTFIPAGAPWQKADLDVSEPRHRWEMTRRAVSGVPGFEADDREVRREGWSYTVDTLATFPEDIQRSSYPLLYNASLRLFEQGDLVTVLDGLSEGEPVVTRGAFMLKSELERHKIEPTP